MLIPMRSFASRHVLTLVLSAAALTGCGRERGREEGAVAETGRAVPLLSPSSPAPTGFTDDPERPADGGTPPPLGAESPSARRCDPNYEPCVPIDSDVDCAGGRGNGPSYVQGPVRVVGRDPYDLDRDGDGIGCER